MAPKKKPTTSSILIDALKFIALAQRDKAKLVTKDFCQISGGFMTASDGVLTAGIKIEEDLNCTPHTGKLLTALNNCGRNLSITQLASSQLSIKSGKFSCFIPCLENGESPMFSPDPPQIEIPPSIKAGFEAIAHLAKENAQTVIESSIQLKSGSMVASNAVVAIEFWHGVDLPTLILPKIFVSAVHASQKTPVSIGFSESSATFWFSDTQWLKTQLYGEAWPEIGYIFDMPTIDALPLPKKFYDGLRSVEDFCEEGREKGLVYLSASGISSHLNGEDGAVFAMKGLKELCFNVRQLKNIEKSCDTIAFDEHRAFFFGANVRGVVMGVK